MPAIIKTSQMRITVSMSAWWGGLNSTSNMLYDPGQNIAPHCDGHYSEIGNAGQQDYIQTLYSTMNLIVSW